MIDSRLLRPLVVLLAAIAIACSSATPSPSPAPTGASTSSATQLPGTSPSQPTTAPTTASTSTPTAVPIEVPTTPPTPSGPLGTPTPARTFTLDTGLAAVLGPQLQAVLDTQRQDGGIPAVGAAITFPDGSIWSSASGDAQVDPPQPASGDTPFVVGSISKTFVAAAIMQLADAGQLALEDPLSNWMPDYPNAANITIQELLHHTSGIYDYFEDPRYNALVFGTMRGHSWTPQEILSTFDRPPYFAPGTSYHYSNTNFIILGLIVEKITGQSLGDVYQQRFFQPLGLSATFFQGAGPPSPDAAQGYLERPAGLKQISDDSGYRPTISAATVAWAAGSVAASAHDITEWGDALYGGHVVSPEALARMEDWTYYPKTDETYGLGTRSRVIEGERVFGHTGSIRGYDAAMWHFPETDMTISALTNLGRIDANPIVDALAQVAWPAAQGTGVAGPPGRLSLARTAPKRRTSRAVVNGAALQAILDHRRLAQHIPGISAAVLYPDGSVWKSGSGLAQVDPDEMATANVPFVLGSITKTFVAGAVMQLADEGKLTLDDALANWLPDYPNAANITLRQLLGHTSGVFNYFEHPAYNKRVFGTDAGHYWTPQEILGNFVKKPYFAPGAGYHYSNTGYILLGLVVESATGLPLGKVLKQRFFKPLGLRHTYFQGSAAAPSNSAMGYLWKSGAWKEWADATNYRPTISAASVAWAAGGVVSTARDVAKWAAALYGGRIVSAAALKAMENFANAPAANGKYGLGTMARISNGVATVGHTGSLRGFEAAEWFYPGTGLTVVVLTNLGRINVNPIVDALAAAALPAGAYRPR